MKRSRIGLFVLVVIFWMGVPVSCDDKDFHPCHGVKPIYVDVIGYYFNITDRSMNSSDSILFENFDLLIAPEISFAIRNQVPGWSLMSRLYACSPSGELKKPILDMRIYPSQGLYANGQYYMESSDIYEDLLCDHCEDSLTTVEYYSIFAEEGNMTLRPKTKFDSVYNGSFMLEVDQQLENGEMETLFAETEEIVIY